MADTLPELADDLDAIALSIEHNPSPTYRFKQLTGTHLRDIADSLRNHARKPHAVLGQPDETQAPYIAGPGAERRGEER